MRVLGWIVAGLLGVTLMAACPPQERSPLDRAQALLQQVQAMSPDRQYVPGRQAIVDALALLDHTDGAATSFEVMSVRCRLAIEAYRFGAIVQERETWRAVCAYYEQLKIRTADDAKYFRAARQYLARALGRTGFEKQAHDLMLQQLQECTATFGAESQEALDARWDLGIALLGTGPAQEARDVWRGFQERMKDMPELDENKQQVLDNLCSALWESGEYEAALGIRRGQLKALDDAKAPVDKKYLQLRVNVAANISYVRGPAEALPLIEEVVELAKQHLEPGDEAILRWHANQVARLLRELGDIDQAIDRLREAMRQFAREHDDYELQESYQQACRQLGLTYRCGGDYASALAWQEEELRLRRLALPSEDAAVLEAMMSLASTRWSCGDRVGARPLYEHVYETRLANLGPSAPVVAGTGYSVAYYRYHAGEVQSARRLLEEVIDGLEKSQVARAQATLLNCRRLFALILAEQGETANAVKIMQDVVAAQRLTAPQLYQLDYALYYLAMVQWRDGQVETAARSSREAMAGLVSHTTNSELEYHRNHALVLAAAGAEADLQEFLKQLTNFAQERLSKLLPLSAREATAAGEQIRHGLDVGISLGKEPTLPVARLFELFESLRAATIPLGNVEELRAGGDFSVLEREIRAAREQLNDLVADSHATVTPALQQKIEAAAERRDGAERKLRAAWSKAGFDPRRITLSDMGAALHSGESAVGFHRYRHSTIDPKPPHLPLTEDRFVAFVAHDGRVARCDLGSASAIEGLVHDWRSAIGKPLPRGRPAGDDRKPDVLTAGRKLREQVLDPVLAQARDPKNPSGKLRLFVCLDDVLHLVPLDALPLNGTQVVGDQHQIVLLSSFAQLTAPRKKPLVGGALVAFGGIDFAAEVAVAATSLAKAASPPVHGPMRAEFFPLRHTQIEVEALPAMFGKFTGGQMKPLVRMGADASKQALFELAPQARYLHLATHGYFAPDSVRSMLDGQDATGNSLSDTVVGLAPLTLCGLAFAGAQHGRDASGVVPGILTAEELAGIDLRRCQLAVLSACETNVGIRRAGQGIQSLQAALQAAGARQAVTSLWRVDDAISRDFMMAFYGSLWSTARKVSVAEALWSAKQSLRKRKDVELRDWAGWVLTGIEL